MKTPQVKMKKLDARDRSIWRRKYYLANREKILATHRAYYAANIEKMRASFVRRRKQNEKKYKEHSRKYYAKNKEKLAAQSRAWRENNPDKSKRSYTNSWLKKKYGITIEQYEEKARQQNYLCAACGEEHKGKTKQTTLHLDHCHSSGKLRGMLCYRCNLGLGLLDENISRLKGLIKYLKGHSK